MSAYYSENDPKAAATLRELIREGLIAPGDVDERSIEDVLPSELTGYTQVHLFAGFGIWSLAFRMAGWPDSRPAWSASCPCQPFSAAGKGGGFADERHLWPAAFWLLQHGKRPEVPIYGEQVASPDGLTWLDLVRSDLETVDHSCWCTVLASAGFGAPIIRQRTYWMARANSEQHDGSGSGRQRRRFEFANRRLAGDLACSAGQGLLSRPYPGVHSGEEGSGSRDAESERLSDAGRLAEGLGQRWDARGSSDATDDGREPDPTFTARGAFHPASIGRSEWRPESSRGSVTGGRSDVRMDESIRTRLERLTGHGDRTERRQEPLGSTAETSQPSGMGSTSDDGRNRPQTTSPVADGDGPYGRLSLGASDDAGGEWAGPTNGFWGTVDWLRCRDDKWRPVEPGTFPLAHGYPERVGILRGAGNAISPQVAAAWIGVTM